MGRSAGQWNHFTEVAGRILPGDLTPFVVVKKNIL